MIWYYSYMTESKDVVQKYVLNLDMAIALQAARWCACVSLLCSTFTGFQV